MARNNPWLNEVLPPDVLNALSNNDPPKQNVIRTVKAFRENPASFSSVVEKRIDDIDKQISTLQQEKSRLSSGDCIRLAIEETYTTICSPFRAIPHDVLQEIARQSMDAHPSPARNRAPMSLTHVSSAWRSVVTASPSFWTTLYIQIRKADHDSLVKHLQVVQAWFRRAGSLPIELFLHVDCKLGPKKNTAYNLRMFLKALAPWTSRICHLGIGGRHWVNFMTQFVDMKWDLSNMVRLDFLGQMEDIEDALENEMRGLASICDKITLFRTAKDLVTVVASQELSVWLRSFAFLPWSQVRHLTLEEHQSSGFHCFTLLKHCPQLQTASLLWFADGISVSETEPYSAKKLEKLQLFDVPLVSDLNELARFFSKTLFHALTHLYISISEVSVEPEDFTDELDPISSFPSLQFFSLMDVTRLPIHLVLDFLSKMPRLQTFNMEISGFLDDEQRTDLNKLCESLTINQGRCDYLPLLEECLFLRSSWGINLLDVTVIAQFIHSRAQDLPCNFSNLKRVTFWGNFGFMTDLREEVVRLSCAEPFVEIDVLSRASSYPGPSYHDPLGLRLTPFANATNPDANYKHVVSHDSSVP